MGTESAESWAEYEREYLKELRASYRVQRAFRLESPSNPTVQITRGPLARQSIVRSNVYAMLPSANSTKARREETAMTARFDQAKTLQAAAYILSLSNGFMNYMKLIKLLYISDRIMWLRWGRPITGATYYCMARGPVLSEVLDLIKQPKEWDDWVKFIQTIDHDVKLSAAPDFDDLSHTELDILKSVTEDFRPYDQWRTVDIVHQFPEWKDPAPNKRQPLTVEAILQAGGKNQSEIDTITRSLDDLRFVQSRYGAES